MTKPLTTATERVIKQAIEMSNTEQELFTRLHFLLCANHTLDDTGRVILNTIFNTGKLAWACDHASELMNNKLTVWDYTPLEEKE